MEVRKIEYKNKYEVGDKVKVRSDLDTSKKYGEQDYSWEEKDEQFKGKIVTITAKRNLGYFIKEDNERVYWCDEMFEGLAEDTKPRPFKVGNKIVAIRRCGEGTGISAGNKGVVCRVQDSGNIYCNFDNHEGYSYSGCLTMPEPRIAHIDQESEEVHGGEHKMEKVIELDNIAKDNLATARVKFDEKNTNDEIEAGIEILRNATDEVNKYESEIREIKEKMKEPLKIIAKYPKN